MNTQLKTLLIAGTVMLSACNSNKSKDTNISTDTSEVSTSVDTMHNSNVVTTSAIYSIMNGMMDRMQNMKLSGDFDLDFANMMIEHHQGAIDMSNVQVEQGSDARLKAMAQKIITKQTAEIDMLRGIVGKYKTHGMKHGEGELQKSMEGMKQNMSVATQGNLDRDFATLMIAHHEGAIDMSEKQITNGMNDELKAMAKKGISDQKKEISEFKSWLESNK